MLIKWEDIKKGDELIIPSNSNLKYLKVTKLGEKSHACSFQKNVTEDITKHNATFYLKDEEGYRDIWLVKREDND